MRKLLSALIVFLFVMSLLPQTSGKAADTAAVLGGGVCINEILPDPTGSPGVDTDGNGIPANGDEFVELYNLSDSSVDISGWQLWDLGRGNWYTFPGDSDDGATVLTSGAYAVVVVEVQLGGSLPTMKNPNSLAFDAAWGSTGVLNNGGDNVVLYDPGEDKYIQLLYNGAAADDPNSYDAPLASATRIGSIEDWGTYTDGKSLTRYPSGDTNVVKHESIPGADDASPTAIELTSFSATSKAMSTSLVLLFLVLFGVSLIAAKKWDKKL